MGTGSALIEVSLTGDLIRAIDLASAAPTVAPSDIAVAPASAGSGATHLYVSDRGVDNNDNPNENDGKIFELTLDSERAPAVHHNHHGAADDHHHGAADDHHGYAHDHHHGAAGFPGTLRQSELRDRREPHRR